MRRLFITLAFFCAGLYVSGQSRTASVFYQYDSYGNCILRTMNGVKKSMKNMQTADTLKVQVVPDVYIEDKLSVSVNRDNGVYYVLSDIDGHVKTEGLMKDRNIIIDVLHYRRGLYLLRVYDESGSVEYKLIKR